MNTSPGYQIVIAALIGAVISLLTTWLNNWFQLQREQQKWYREQLSQIYLKCISLLNEVCNEIWIEKINVDLLTNILNSFELSLTEDFPNLDSFLKGDYAIVPANKVDLFKTYYISIQELLFLLKANLNLTKFSEDFEGDLEIFLSKSWEKPYKFERELGSVKIEGAYVASNRISPKIVNSFPADEKEAILSGAFIRFPSKVAVNNLRAKIIDLMINDSRLKKPS